MKLTTFLLIIALAQVSAKGLAQKITLDIKNTPIEKVLQSIRDQSGYGIIYDARDLKDHKVTLKLNNASVEDAIKELTKDLPLSYKIVRTSVVLTRIEPSFLARVASAFANIDVRGVVVDENNTPLVGAVVKVKGSSISAPTNTNGEFLLKNVNEDAIIIISYLGYKTQEVKASKNIGSVKLTARTDKLEEVEINAGYYSVTQRERTGSISRIDAKTIENAPVNNVMLALQNRVPGLQILQQTGVPGGGISVQIRGRNSIASGNDPLYIIDGVTYPSSKISSGQSNGILTQSGSSPMSLVNPNDIESVEVLKDADATAIYGSRGANGVILIKTKRGISGKNSISANFAQGFSQVDKHLDLLNTQQYLEMRKEAYQKDGSQPGSTDYDVNGVWDPNKYTDWQGKMIGGTASVLNSSASINGGAEKINYQLAGNFYKEGTVFPGNFGLTRGGIHSSLNLGSDKDRFNVSFTTNYSHSKSNLPRRDLTRYSYLAPNAPEPYDASGKINWANNTVEANPMAEIIVTNDASTDNLIANLNLSYKVIKNMVFKTSFGYSIIKRDELQKTPLSSYTPIYSSTAADRLSYFSDIKNSNLIVEPQFDYKNKLGPGEISTLVGMAFQENINKIRTILGTTFNSDAQMDDFASAGVLKSAQNINTQYRYLAFFTRINYNVKNKYFVNITARRDGSSRFGAEKQFANFGAIGIAWVFSDEKFVSGAFPFLSFGKLRSSFGITGNDQIADYGYLQLWDGTSGTYQGLPTTRPRSGSVGNPEFAWEVNKKAEMGLELGFLNNDITFEVSYYRNRSSNQLVGDPLPPSTGSGSVTANRNAVVENTGLEISSNFKILKKANFRWSVAVNLTIPKNKLISYPNLAATSDAINFIVGKPLAIRKIYNVSGVDAVSGQYNIEDFDKNSLINDADRYLSKFTGVYSFGGLQNTFSYKRLTLDFLISFTKQNGINYMQFINVPGMGSSLTAYGNMPSAVLERWQNSGDLSNVQRFSAETLSARYVAARGNGGLSIVDASFLRLKNASISYNLPSKLLSAMKINKCTLNLQGQNILTISDFVGLDPETQDINILPPLRTITFGLTLTF